MRPSDDLTTDPDSFCYSKGDEVYVVYVHPGKETTSLNLGNSGNTFSVKWYDPRNGGDLLDGSVTSVDAKGAVALGNPPNDQDKDWVILVQKKNQPK